MTIASYPSQKAEIQASESLRTPVSSPSSDESVRPYLHRHATRILHQIRKIKADLQNNPERLVLDYIINNTIGRNKTTDQISNSQFIQGKRKRKTGQVIDLGCGLHSLTTIRKARRALVEKGIIFAEPVTDLSGASGANRYGLVFIREGLALAQMEQKVSRLKRHTRRGYQSVHPTNKSLKEISKQRCQTTSRKKQGRAKHYMDPEHVNYLVDQIEQVTGDQHSRGAFAQLALSVPEGKLLELLSILKDRGNIQNKGAWFYAAAKKYRTYPVIRADAATPAEQPTHTTGSFRQWVLAHKRSLIKKLSMGDGDGLQDPRAERVIRDGYLADLYPQ